MGTQGVFDIRSEQDFEMAAMVTYKFQYKHNAVYREFCNLLNTTPERVHSLKQIPFLPIHFFKSKKVQIAGAAATHVFSSSGTTGQQVSKHYISDIDIYERSFLTAFNHFYGSVEDYVVLALLPSYLERSGSSLVYMVQSLIEKSNHPDSGFFLHDYKLLIEKLKALDASARKVLLIGVSYALLDLIALEQLHLTNTVVMETGGMKGRRKEMIRKELHHQLKQGFGVPKIHSEYGMTELLSQAYSKGDGLFKCPPWMQVVIRDSEDPLTYLQQGRTGGINIIDLANINSCSFIATQDLGKVFNNGTFEVLGRFDHSDIRGCNLMVL